MDNLEISSETNKKRGKIMKWKYPAVIVLCASSVVLLYLFFHSGKESTEPVFSKNARIGIMPGKTEKQVREMLQQELDESMVAFSINSSPIFEDGKSEGELMLEAPANNFNNVEFVIRLDKTGEIVYESGLLHPNQYILKDKLQTESTLKKGSYPCTADIRMYDKKTNKMKGMVQAALTITIKN